MRRQHIALAVVYAEISPMVIKAELAGLGLSAGPRLLQLNSLFRMEVSYGSKADIAK